MCNKVWEPQITYLSRINIIRQKSLFCWPQGQLPPIRNYLLLYQLTYSEDTFISGLKAQLLRNKQTLSHMAFNNHPTSRQDGAKKPGTNLPSSQEPLSKGKQGSFEEYELDLEGFHVADQSTCSNSSFKAQPSSPSGTVMELAPRPPPLTQINTSSQPAAVMLTLRRVLRAGWLRQQRAPEPPGGLVNTQTTRPEFWRPAWECAF